MIDSIRTRKGNRRNIYKLSESIDIVDNCILSHIEMAQDIGVNLFKIQEYCSNKNCF